MPDFFLKQLLGPIVRRGGTAVSSFLVGLGVAQTSTEQIVLGLSTAVMVAAELALSAKARK